MPLSITAESDSSPFAKGAVEMELATFATERATERSCLTDVDRTSWFWKATILHGIPLPFGPLALSITNSVH